MSIYVPTGLISHTRKVQSLYKRVLRNILAEVVDRDKYRYHAVLMRHRFDQNKDIKDMRIAKKLLIEAEEELFLNKHPQQMIFPYSVGGVAHDREHYTPDHLLDLWYPIEKAAYPKYFARREQRKKEYIERYIKKYGEINMNHEDHS